MDSKTPNKAGRSVVTNLECAITVGENENRNKATNPATGPLISLAQTKIMTAERIKKTMRLATRYPFLKELVSIR